MGWSATVASDHVNDYHYVKVKGKTQFRRVFKVDEY